MAKLGNYELPDVKFDWTISLGNVAIVVGGILTAGTAYGTYISQQERTLAAMEAHNTRLSLIERSRAEELGRYVPLINAMTNADNVRDERIGNLATAIIEMRKTNSEISSKLASISEDLAGIKAQLRIMPPQRP